MFALPSCFKAYDIRGRVPEDLDDDLAYRVGQAFVEFTGAKRVVVGRDVRESSAQLATALSKGIMHQGADVYDIGLCGTEEVYYATYSEAMDGGIMVTASHNPLGYNGLKIVREESRPVSADTGLQTIGQLTIANEFKPAEQAGERWPLALRERYAEYLARSVDLNCLKPLKIVTNPGNGGAGLVLDALADYLPFEFIRIQHEPDGSFPNGIPNPLLPEKRAATREAVLAHKADLGLAWDGDFDRCFFFDETGGFVEGYFLVGLIAETLLQQQPGEAVVYDPRLTWNTVDLIQQHGGRAIQSKSGHAFIKEVMREENAIYGGEMSAHHYFRDFAYCDNGFLPWLLIAQLISQSGKPLSSLVAERQAMYPVSGEINREIGDADAVLEAIEARYGLVANSVDRMDGLGFEFDNWRFNVRKSNTEPLVRLNVETRRDEILLREKTAELLTLLDAH